MENKMSDAQKQQRQSERRVSTNIEPPPYETRDGEMSTDRRSTFDRRATWIREFSLETSSGQES
jgi:hypothetical protein